MISLRSGSSALAFGALVLAASTLAGAPASAQFGYGGYGYDRPSPPFDYGRPPPPPPFEYGRPPPPPPDYYGERRRDYGPPPPRFGGGQARGSFVGTCSDINQEGFYLVATCRDVRGRERRSQIDIRQCRSIANFNGRLACE